MGVRLLTVLLCLVTAFNGVVWAQQDRGTLTGTITDVSGAVVPNAKVTITNVATNATYESVSSESGQYTVPNLPVGQYSLRFEAQGFKATVRESITLNVAQIARIDAQMQIGAATESIQVSAEAPLLQTETPDVGTLLTNRTVVDLPLGFGSGRYAENFAYRLTPGVSGNNWESRINGSPSFSKEIVLDGASATIYIGGHMGESSPSMEALEEFRVQTSGMSAEFGRTGGGVFNFVMKSGTNQFHGSALGQIHNEWMDANTFANNFYGRPKRLDRRHNYAFSGGAPIIIPKIYDGRNRTFFYASYERYKEAYGGGGAPGVTVPLPEWFQGDLSRYLTNEQIGVDALDRPVFRGQIFDPATTRIVNGSMVRDPFRGNIIPANRISPIARNIGTIFERHYQPAVRDANGQLALINNAFFPVSNQAGFTQDQFSIKLDHNLSTSHKINGSYVSVDRPRNLLDQGGVWDFNDPLGGPFSRVRLQQVKTWYGRFAYDWTLSPMVLNHLQLGFNRQENPSVSRHLEENGAQALGLSGLQTFNYPEINFGGNDRVNFPTIGYQANDILAAQNYSFIDTVSVITGSHSLRMGVDYRRTYMRSRANTGPGAFNFSNAVTGLQGFNQTGHGFASMLLGEVRSANVPVNTPTGSRWTNLALFFQDDFKVTSRLTLNLGLRWDYQPLPVEHYDRYSNFDPTLIDPISGLPGAISFAGEGQGRSGVRNFGKNQYNDFSPRIGFAYQVSSTTAVRGAYGIFYHGRNPNGWSGVPWGQTMGFQQFNEVQAPNLPYEAAFNWGNGYPGVVRDRDRNPSLAANPYNSWGPVSWDPDAGRVGNTQQWNFNIQQQLPGNIVFDIGYVGSKSTGVQANELRRLHQMHPKYLALGDLLTRNVNSQAAATALHPDARYPAGFSGDMPLWQALSPFPHLATWNTINSAFVPLGFGTYHSMQLQLNKRYSHGIWLQSNYTWSKTIDNLNSAFGDTWGMNGGRPMDYYNLSLDKSVSASDRTHVAKLGAAVDLPFGRGRRFGSDSGRVTNFVAGGWTVQFIGNYSSGEPLGFGGTGVPVGNFSGQRGLIVNPEGKPLKLNWDSTSFDMASITTPGTTAHRYLDTSLVVDPASVSRYQLGNAAYRYSQLRAPAYFSDDLSLQKNFRPIESMRIQFRVEALNAFNRHRFNQIETNTASPLFGQVTGVSDDRRQFQFGVRADW